MATKTTGASGDPEKRRSQEPFTLVDLPTPLPPHLVFADPAAASRKSPAVHQEFELGSSTSATCGLPIPAIGGGKIKKIWDALRRDGSSSTAGSSRYEDAIDEEWEDIVDEACFPHLPMQSYTGGLGDARLGNFDLLSHLPFEIALYVLSFLPFQTILVVGAVSRPWRIIASDDTLWKGLFDREPGWRVKSRYLSSLRAQGSEIPWRNLYISRWELHQRWKDRRFKPVQRVLEGHMDSVYCFEHLPELYHPTCTTGTHQCEIPNVLITGSRDHSIRIWDLSPPERGTQGQTEDRVWSEAPLLELNRHQGSVLCIQFDKTGFMASGSSDTTILIWDLGWGAEKITFPSSRPPTASITPDEPMKLGSHVIRRKPRPLKQLTGHTGGVLDLKVNERWIASCSKDSTLALHSRQTLELLYTLSGHDGPVNSIGIQDDQMVSASGDGRIILWDLRPKGGKKLRTLVGHEKGLACVIFKNDVILSGSNDNKIKVWSASTGSCLRTLAGHKGLVRALAYQEEAPFFVSASYDRTVRIWDLADESGKAVREFKGHHASQIFRVGADAARIISSSHDRKVVILDFASDLPYDLGDVFY